MHAPPAPLKLKSAISKQHKTYFLYSQNSLSFQTERKLIKYQSPLNSLSPYLYQLNLQQKSPQHQIPAQGISNRPWLDEKPFTPDKPQPFSSKHTIILNPAVGLSW